jgi:hypothetical protein
MAFTLKINGTPREVDVINSDEVTQLVPPLTARLAPGSTGCPAGAMMCWMLLARSASSWALSSRDRPCRTEVYRRGSFILNPSSRFTSFDHLVGAGEPFALMTQHAQIAERKYCRPHARPFRLRFARVVAVFPVCSPATL